MSNIVKVSLSEIRENAVALRSVNKQSEEYLGLVDSIRNLGFFTVPTVRAKNDETGKVFYEIIDGLHRITAARDAGVTEIDVNVMEMDEADVLIAQIMSNVHRIETKPVEYAKQLVRILNANPLWTEAELASKLAKSITWIKDRLGLTKIADEKIQQLIDDGKINLSNAYVLAKLPAEEAAEFLDRAMTVAPGEFMPMVQARIKEIREAKRKGLDAAPQEFAPVAYLQKMSDIKAEAQHLDSIKGLIAQGNITDPVEAARVAIQWVMHLDPVSVKVQAQADEDRRRVKEEAKKARAAERAQINEQKAKEKAAEAAAESAKAREALQG